VVGGGVVSADVDSAVVNSGVDDGGGHNVGVVSLREGGVSVSRSVGGDSVVGGGSVGQTRSVDSGGVGDSGVGKTSGEGLSGSTVDGVVV